MGTFRITNAGKFIAGANYSSSYVPLSDGLPGHDSGFDSPVKVERLSKDFKNFSANGIHAVRMPLFSDGRTGGGIIFDKDHPIGIEKERIQKSIDNILRVAKENNIYVSFVLLDHQFCFKEVSMAKPGVKLDIDPGTKSGHGRTIADPNLRKELINNVAIPVLNMIGKNSNVLSFEFINEPESIFQRNTFVKGANGPMNPKVEVPLSRKDMESFKDTLREFRDHVHTITGAQFTAGSLSITLANEWVSGANPVLDPKVDYLSPHYYGQNNEPPYKEIYNSVLKELQDSIPVVWGEYAANGSLIYPALPFPRPEFRNAMEFLDDALNNKIKGTFGWSAGDLQFGEFPMEMHKQFVKRNQGSIELGVIDKPTDTLPTIEKKVPVEIPKKNTWNPNPNIINDNIKRQTDGFRNLNEFTNRTNRSRELSERSRKLIEDLQKLHRKINTNIIKQPYLGSHLPRHVTISKISRPAFQDTSRPKRSYDTIHAPHIPTKIPYYTHPQPGISRPAHGSYYTFVNHDIDRAGNIIPGPFRGTSITRHMY